MEDLQFYRYEWREYASLDYDGEYCSPKFPNPSLTYSTFNLVKETPKGYWISYGWYKSSKLRGRAKWVSKTARKRFAYPSKEEALNNFIKRQERRIRILDHQLNCCKIAVQKAKMLQK